MTYSTAEEWLGPTLQYNEKRKLWRLTEDYTFEWGDIDFRKRKFLAAGYEYNKASTPWFLRNLFPHDAEWEGPSLFHDKGYEEKGEFRDLDRWRFETKINGVWRIDSGRWKRKDEDLLFKLMGECSGARNVRLYYSAVRIYPPNMFKGF